MNFDFLEKQKFDFEYVHKNPEDLIDEKEKQQFYTDASLLNKNKILHRILEHFIQLNGNYLARVANNQEQLFWGRANINAIELLKTELNRLDNLYKESIRKEEDFDKSEII